MMNRITAFAAVSITALVLGFFMPEQWLTPVYHYSGYYFMVAATVIWLALLIDVIKNNFIRHIQQHGPALVLAVFLISLIFQMSPPKYKILADEANLVSVSMAMHQNKTASMLLQGMAVEYYPFDYEQKPDQRPLFYPFAISVVHALSGYSPFNGIVVNFFSGIGILFLMYLLTAQIFSRFFGFIAMATTATFPVFIFWVTSSGFETINLLFIIIVLLTLFLFLKHRDVKYAELSLYSLVLLANCRYESIIFFFSLSIVTPFFVKKDIIAKYRFPVFCLPLFFLPLAWQRQIVFFNSSIWTPGGVKTPEQIFGIENFFRNVSPNLFALTGLNTDFGFLFIVFIAAIAGSYLACKVYLKAPDRIDSTHQFFGIYLLISATVLFIVYTSFYWGHFTSDIDNRLSVSFIPFFLLPAIYCMHKVVNHNHVRKKILVVSLLMQFIYYWPIGAEHPLLKKNNFYYINQRITQYLYKNFDLKTEKLLMISDRPNFYVILGLGSIGFKKAVNEQKKIKYLSKVYYDKIIVLQKCKPFTNELFATDRMDNSWQLKTIARINVAKDYYYRISEVTSVGKN